MDSVTIEFPITSQGLNVLVMGAVVAGLTLLVWGILLGVAGRERRMTFRLLIRAFSGVYGVIWFAVFGAVLWSLWQIFSGLGAPLSGAATLGPGAVIVALLGAPFVIWSTVVKQRTLELGDEAHFNDKINAATEALYSRRQVSRVVEADGREEVLTEWQDDILQRSAAIDRLEGLVRERPGVAPRVASMLSIYVRELSRENPPEVHARYRWMRLVEPIDDTGALSENDALSRLDLNPDAVSVETMKKWARTLTPVRNDMEKAAQTLGRLKDIPGVDQVRVRIDLRNANLQGFDLDKLNFSAADFSDASAAGVSMQSTRLCGAKMERTRLEAALFLQASMNGNTDMRRSILEGADLSLAQMECVNLSHAKIEKAHLLGTILDYADLRSACLKSAILTDTGLSEASLDWAELEAAFLNEVGFSDRTGLSGTLFEGVAFRNMDLSKTIISTDQVKSAFGDASVVLSDAVGWPAHWPNRILPNVGANSYLSELEKWRKAPQAYPSPGE
ncbi:MAG: pentapeptide repeat-containing protein [Pararhodobacter sp.]|nr:pentapeptide repeat-containing protein [Pararhodobacter sp.]